MINDNPWLSPVESEREWQEQSLKEIFGHYPNASPAWQYMNGLIYAAKKQGESLERIQKLEERISNLEFILEQLTEPSMDVYGAVDADLKGLLELGRAELSGKPKNKVEQYWKEYFKDKA